MKSVPPTHFRLHFTIFAMHPLLSKLYPLISPFQGSPRLKISRHMHWKINAKWKTEVHYTCGMWSCGYCNLCGIHIVDNGGWNFVKESHNLKQTGFQKDLFLCSSTKYIPLQYWGFRGKQKGWSLAVKPYSPSKVGTGVAPNIIFGKLTFSRNCNHGFHCWWVSCRNLRRNVRKVGDFHYGCLFLCEFCGS